MSASLSQTADAAFPDRPRSAAGTGLRIDLSAGNDGQTLAVALAAPVDPLHVRLMIRPVDIAGGRVALMRGCDDQADHVADLRAHLPLHLDEGPVRLTFTTPYVLADGQSPWDGDPTALARRLERELAEAVRLAGGDEVNPPTIERVDAALRPDFVGRWSYERGCRENRLVAWPGSRLTLHLSEPGDLETTLALAQTFGLGGWNEWGFGRFKVTVQGASP